MQRDFYWSGTEFAPNSRSAWVFDTTGGYQDLSDKRNNYFAMAVRRGDVLAAQVPEPASLALVGVALLGVCSQAAEPRSTSSPNCNKYPKPAWHH